MARIVSIHSFRGGTGKSNSSANLSTLLAMDGLRVGVVDTDIQSPGIHVLFNLKETEIKHTLNDYLWEKCAIEDAAHDVTDHVGGSVPGKIFLIPSSLKPGEIARIVDKGYDVGMLNNGLQDAVRKLSLDVLVIDTHPGINEETLLSIAISQVLIIVMRPDQQDYLGTGVTVSIARRLKVPYMYLLVNKTPMAFNFDDVKARVEQTYNSPVCAVLPHSDEMMTLAGEGVFVANYPDHDITRKLRQVAALIMQSS